MGRIKKDVLGNVLGRVGNVVGSSWKGIAYMRSFPLHVKDAQTVGQKKQRTRFAMSLAFLQPITPYVRIGYSSYAIKCTAFNAALSYTVSNAIGGTYPDFVIDYTKVLVSRGALTVASTPNATVNPGRVTFTWNDNSGQGDAQASDFAMPMVYNIEIGEVIYSTTAATRTEATATLDTPSHWSGHSMVLYLGFATADGKMASNSICLGQEIAI